LELVESLDAPAKKCKFLGLHELIYGEEEDANSTFITKTHRLRFNQSMLYYHSSFFRSTLVEFTVKEIDLTMENPRVVKFIMDHIIKGIPLISVTEPNALDTLKFLHKYEFNKIYQSFIAGFTTTSNLSVLFNTSKKIYDLMNCLHDFHDTKILDAIIRSNLFRVRLKKRQLTISYFCNSVLCKIINSIVLR
jgi:hypothetical protein